MELGDPHHADAVGSQRGPYRGEGELPAINRYSEAMVSGPVFPHDIEDQLSPRRPLQVRQDLGEALSAEALLGGSQDPIADNEARLVGRSLRDDPRNSQESLVRAVLELHPDPGKAAAKIGFEALGLLTRKKHARRREVLAPRSSLLIDVLIYSIEHSVQRGEVEHLGLEARVPKALEEQVVEVLDHARQVPDLLRLLEEGCLVASGRWKIATKRFLGAGRAGEGEQCDCSQKESACPVGLHGIDGFQTRAEA